MSARKDYNCLILLAFSFVAQVTTAVAQEASQRASDEIVVTAQKREQSVNSVGMSINVVDADALSRRGFVDTADLVKLSPGFTYAQTAYTTPVYTLRGVGLYDAGLASSPAVSVYIDEAPLPYLVMTRGAALDTERVEVLKGPQGTLFGQNSTGGAINYIAAKPTPHFAAGGNVSYMRFSEVDASGYISGPIAESLRARFSFRTIQGGDWQKSISRPDDTRGGANLTMGRLLLDWTPAPRLSFMLNLNGWIDNSETQAPQLTAIQPGFPPNASPELLASPIIPDRPRLAEWSTDWPDYTDDVFLQGSIRADYKLTAGITLSSISVYSKQTVSRFNEADGTTTQNLDTRLHGDIRALNQEIRLAGESDQMNWIVGATYENADVNDTVDFRYPGLTSRVVGPPPLPELESSVASTVQDIESAAAFANFDVYITDAISLQAGMRYTTTTRDAANCNFDPGGIVGPNFEFLQSVLNPPGSPIVPIEPGDCYTLFSDSNDGLIKPTIIPYQGRLKEENVSYRFGATYAFSGAVMGYMNYSRGFKAGLISNVSGATLDAFNPVPHERLDAWEAGFKTSLLGQALQWNVAAFYYDYRRKQIRGRIADPIFGLLETLVSIPESEIYGFETELATRPVEGLRMSAGLTYLHSQITGSFNSFNQSGAAFDFQGSRLPYTPRWQGVADLEYAWNAGGLRPFIGGSLTYHSEDNATFTLPTAPAPDFHINSYALIDLRVGIVEPNGTWDLSLFGRNVTNEYYTTTGFNGSDTRYRLSGRPAIWGIQFRLRTN